MREALLLLAPALPLLLAAAVGSGGPVRRAAFALAPWAALPALAAALAPPAAPLELPWLLLGTRIGLDQTGRALLVFTALLWTVAGWYGRAYGRRDPRRDRFAGLFLATMSGNVGAIVAADAATFSLAFALMTFAGYGLVVHEGSAAAWRAGRVYLVLAVFGEALLLVAILLAAAAAGSFALDALAAAAATAPQAELIRLLVVAGFGVKAGLLPLHVWLPLAHPIAPTPASAVLSGAMIKVGVLGWMRFLPLGVAPADELGVACVAAGALAAFYGVAIGLTQIDAKALLAYSSISQMGFLTIGLGLGLAEPAAWPAASAAVLLYAAHHGLAKGALFLSAGIVAAGGSRRAVVAGSLLPALALAGAPLTSGAVAKLALKDAAAAAWPAAAWLPWLLALAAAGTTLLMVRCLVLFARREAPAAHGSGGAGGLVAPWAGSLAAVAAVTWVMAWQRDPGLAEALLAPSALLAAAWPPLAGLAVATLWWTVRRGREGQARVIPAGDVLVVVGRLLAWVGGQVTRAAARWATVAGGPWGAGARRRADCVAGVGRIECGLRATGTTGALAMGLLAALAVGAFW